MFDMFWKPKFYTKCKSYVKLTKTRLDVIRKKKSTILKFLKNDIADLLRSGLDYNAYGRAEGFLVERNILSCYDLIDEFCGTIFNQLSVLIKQSECPEECREAVASLIYAAATTSDLPELRELRSLFTERYGSSLESFTNKELIEKSRPMPLTKEMKLQLLQEIAQESAIEWNSKALEQQLYTPPQNEPKVVGPRRADKRNKTKVASVPVYERKPNSLRKKDNSDDDDDSIFDSSSEDNTTETSTRASSTDQDVQKGVSEDEVDNQKPFYLRFIPPPYLKPKPSKKEANLEEPQKVSDHVDNHESNEHDHKPISEEKPKPRSVRRRNFKPQPARDINIDGAEKIGLSRIRGKETMIGEEKGPRDDEEERMLDGLLMHYSNKKTTQAKGNLKAQGRQEKDNTEQPQRPRNTKAEDVDVAVPARAVSFPTDTANPTEPVKRHARTNSLQTDMVGHVHPKLPDYDQLAARFAALRGK